MRNANVRRRHARLGHKIVMPLTRDPPVAPRRAAAREAGTTCAPQRIATADAPGRTRIRAALTNCRSVSSTADARCNCEIHGRSADRRGGNSRLARLHLSTPACACGRNDLLARFGADGRRPVRPEPGGLLRRPLTTGEQRRGIFSQPDRAVLDDLPLTIRPAIASEPMPNRRNRRFRRHPAPPRRFRPPLSRTLPPKCAPPSIPAH